MAVPRILLVDDDSDDRTIITDALNHLKAENVISCAENGEAALKLLGELYEKKALPSLIVLDLNMPKMNGRETLKNLKSDKRFMEIAVIIYSTSINPLEEKICMNLGAQQYITKPISYKESLVTAELLLRLC
jgi:CheY-like chemotaxis protein